MNPMITLRYRKISQYLAILLLQFFYPTAIAHHSGNMFDREQIVELVGIVREFQWTSPHIWIQVLVISETGITEEWSIEGGVPNRLFRSGWRPNTFKPGHQVILQAYPMRDGARAG